MAAIHGNDIIAEGELEKLNRLDEVVKQLVVVTVLDRLGPVEQWNTDRVHRRTGLRPWLEDPKDTLLRSSGKTFQDLVQSRRALTGSKDLGKK